MVKKCCVSGCKSESYSNCGISFFKFPTGHQLRQLWINAVPGNISKFSVVCHHHFKSEDILAVSSRPKLKSNAVPSIFPNVKKFPNVRTVYVEDKKENTQDLCLNNSEEPLPGKSNLSYRKSTSNLQLQRNIKILQQRLKRRNNTIKNLESIINIIKKECKNCKDLLVNID